MGDDALQRAVLRRHLLYQFVEGAYEAGQVAGMAGAVAVGRVIVGNGREARGGDVAHQRVELAGAA